MIMHRSSVAVRHRISSRQMGIAAEDGQLHLDPGIFSILQHAMMQHLLYMVT